MCEGERVRVRASEGTLCLVCCSVQGRPFTRNGVEFAWEAPEGGPQDEEDR